MLPVGRELRYVDREIRPGVREMLPGVREMLPGGREMLPGGREMWTWVGCGPGGYAPRLGVVSAPVLCC